MFIDEYHICQLIEERQWAALACVLSQLFSSSKQHLHRDYILYLDSCVDYYVHGCPFKPTTKRYVRGVIHSGLDPDYSDPSRLSKHDIRQFASTIQDVIGSTSEGKIKTLLELVHEHIYTSSQDVSSDVLSRYINYFEKKRFNDPLDCLDKFSALINRYYVQLKENWGSVHFSEHEYIIKRLLYLNCVVRNNDPILDPLQNEKATQIISMAIEKLSYICFDVDRKEYSLPELIETIYTTEDSVFSLSIDRLSYGYNPKRKHTQLTLTMREPSKAE